MATSRLAGRARRCGWRWLLGPALGCALLVVAPTAVLADDYEAALGRAVAAKEQALDTGEPAAWERALAEFEAARDLRLTAETEYEIAFAAAALGRVEVAVKAYGAALALGLSGRAAERARDYLVAYPVASVASTEAAPATEPESALGTATYPATAPAPGALAPSAPANPAPPVAAAVGGTVPAPPSADPSLPSSAPRRERHRLPAGPVLIVAGSAVAVAGGVMVVVAATSLSLHRDRLPKSCAILRGADECAAVYPGATAYAQDEVDAIATAKALRIGAIAGLGAGLATGLLGVALTERRAAAQAAGARVELTVVAGGAVVGLTRSF